MSGYVAPTGSELGVVVLMGVGIVFVGLVTIVFLCTIMSAIVKALDKKGAVNAPAAAAPAPVAAQPAVIENRGELVAAISAVIAEELGEDISAIKITSLKKL